VLVIMCTLVLRLNANRLRDLHGAEFVAWEARSERT
jgi:hypothetical protein